MRALVMAAGLGTRLKPLTDKTPKPLVKVLGRPMVACVLDSLAAGGFGEAIINMHYLPGKMRAFAKKWNGDGGKPHLELQDESARILESGGSVSMAAPWLFANGVSTAMVCNADVIATPDLAAFTSAHARLVKTQGVECTLMVVAHPLAGAKYNGIRLAGEKIAAFERPGTPDPALWHFPGYYLLEKRAIARLPAAGAAFGIMEKLWLPLLAEGKLGAWIYPGHYLDLGTSEDLREAEAYLQAQGLGDEKAP